MRRIHAVILSLVMLLPAATGPAASGDASLITKKSPYSVAETLDRLTTIITGKGLTVFARIDHAAGAAKVGQTLAPNELVIFGNPKIGTPLMQADPQVGIALPLKMLAYEDADGQVWLAYAPPQALKTRFGLAGQDKVIETMTGALAKLTDAAVKSE